MPPVIVHVVPTHWVGLQDFNHIVVSNERVFKRQNKVEEKRKWAKRGQLRPETETSQQRYHNIERRDNMTSGTQTVMPEWLWQCPFEWFG